jgi:hypothetical protein
MLDVGGLQKSGISVDPAVKGLLISIVDKVFPAKSRERRMACEVLAGSFPELHTLGLAAMFEMLVAHSSAGSPKVHMRSKCFECASREDCHQVSRRFCVSIAWASFDYVMYWGAAPRTKSSQTATRTCAASSRFSMIFAQAFCLPDALVDMS